MLKAFQIKKKTKKGLFCSLYRTKSQRAFPEERKPHYVRGDCTVMC